MKGVPKQPKLLGGGVTQDPKSPFVLFVFVVLVEGRGEVARGSRQRDLERRHQLSLRYWMYLRIATVATKLTSA